VLRPSAIAVIRHVAGLLAVSAALVCLIFWPLAAARVAAVDPSSPNDPSRPSSIIFGRPQYLVYWESHATYDGPATDNTYALFTDLPIEPGHFVVPDGTGGVFHYRGRLEGGPYKTDAELCPQMIALGIPSLVAWPPSVVGKTIVVDCAAYRQAASGAASAEPSVVPGGSRASGGQVAAEIVRLGGAAAGLALATAGAAGLVRSRRPRRVDSPASAPDPCAAQLADLHVATSRGKAIGDLLQANRGLQALLDRQIVHLANVVIPGSFGLDIAFILAGQWGSKLGWGFVPKEILSRALDSAIKDVVKEAAKQGFDAAGQRALDMDAFHANVLKGGQKGVEGGAKAILKQLIKDGLVSRQTASSFATASSSAAQLQARLEIVKRYGDDVAGPMADALGHVMSMYNAGIGVAELREKLDILRIKRDAVLDQTATLEVELESALEQAGYARDRLDHCQRINAPGWRP
jgi:hypothetical protein